MDTVTNGSNTFGIDYHEGTDMNTYDDEPMMYGPPTGWELDAVDIIETYIFPVAMLLGIVGNLLAMPVLYVISMRTWSTILYLSILSCVDLAILLIRCGNQWYKQITLTSLSLRIINSSDALCKTYMFAFNFILYLSPWLMVAVAVEMTIATRWPQRLYIMCSIERASNVVMLLVIVIVCLNINYFWTWGVPSPAFGCRYTEEFSTEFRDTIWPAMTSVIQFLTPLLMVSIGVFVTVSTMISRRSEDEKDIERELKKYFLELTTLRDFRIVCLVLSVIFMCLTFFTLVVSLVNFLVVKNYVLLDDKEYREYMLVKKLVKAIDLMFYAFFYSLKIFVYVGCSSTFRATLKNGLASFKRRVKQILSPMPKPGRIVKRMEEAEEGEAEENSTWNTSGASQSRKPLIENSSSSSPKIEEQYPDQRLPNASNDNENIIFIGEEENYFKVNGTEV